MKLPMMMMRLALAGVFVAVATASHAEPLIKKFPGELSANVAFTTEYFFRGLSQADDGVPSIQGGIDYNHPSGVYLGVWGSNVKFTDASIEIDFYGGFNGSFGKKGSWGVGGIYYYYPGAAGSLDYDFWEALISLGYDFGFASATVSVNYSPEYFADSGDAVYVALGVDVPVGKYVTLNGHVGHQSIDDNAAFGTPDYVDFGGGVSVEVLKGVSLSVAYTGTDLSNSECPDACDQVVATISAAF